MGAQAVRCGADQYAAMSVHWQIPIYKLICSTGKKTVACENLSTPARENIPLRVCPKSNLQFPTSRPTRGAYRDRHGRWAWDAMDAAASGAILCADE
jgi:hypothetical protein